MGMAEDCTIGWARVEDLGDVLRIYYENSLEILGISRIEEMLEYDKKLYGPAYKFLSPRNLREWYARDGRRKLFVARCQGRVVGFGILHVTGTTGYLEELHVAKQYRGRGIGTRLLEFFESEAARRGARILILEAHEGAIEFFRARGYTPIRTEKQPYMNKITYTIMAKSKP